MINGLGPDKRQTMYKNDILDVEKLVKILPSTINFYEPIDINTIKESAKVTLEVVILSYIETLNDDEKLCFTVSCGGKELNAVIKNHPSIKKKVNPGKKIKIYGFFDLDSKEIDIETMFDINEDVFESIYEVGGLASSLIQNFTEKGLQILGTVRNEIPTYIKEKLGVKTYLSILNDIHMPKSQEIFMKAIKNYTYEIFFNFFVSYYYYIVSTSTKRIEENKLDPVKVNSVINSFDDFATIEKKKNINEILNEFKKPFYTNIVLENFTNEDKVFATMALIITKVSMKKQVVIIAKENFELYTSLKEELLKYNVKVDIMARKGRNKENFSQFNSGKYDVLITPPVNFETISTQDVGLVICDDEQLNIFKRYSLNCNNTDSLFFTKTKYGRGINKQIFKNIDIINLEVENKSLKDVMFDNLLNNENYKILYNLLDEECVNELINSSSIDAYDFIVNKRFKEDKNNYEYFKKLIDDLVNVVPIKK